MHRTVSDAALSNADGVCLYTAPWSKIAIRVTDARYNRTTGRLTAVLQFGCAFRGFQLPCSGLTNLSSSVTRTRVAKRLEAAYPVGTWQAILDDLYAKLQSELADTERCTGQTGQIRATNS